MKHDRIALSPLTSLLQAVGLLPFVHAAGLNRRFRSSVKSYPAIFAVLTAIAADHHQTADLNVPSDQDCHE